MILYNLPAELSNLSSHHFNNTFVIPALAVRASYWVRLNTEKSINDFF